MWEIFFKIRQLQLLPTNVLVSSSKSFSVSFLQCGIIFLGLKPVHILRKKAVKAIAFLNITFPFLLSFWLEDSGVVWFISFEVNVYESVNRRYLHLSVLHLLSTFCWMFSNMIRRDVGSIPNLGAQHFEISFFLKNQGHFLKMKKGTSLFVAKCCGACVILLYLLLFHR